MRFHAYNPLVTGGYWGALGANNTAEIASLEQQYINLARQIESSLHLKSTPVQTLPSPQSRLAELKKLKPEYDYKVYLWNFIDQSKSLLEFIRQNFRYSTRTEKMHPLNANAYNVLFGYSPISIDYRDFVHYAVSNVLYSSVEPAPAPRPAIPTEPAVPYDRVEPLDRITAADEPAEPIDRITPPAKPVAPAPVPARPKISPLAIALLLGAGVFTFWLLARKLK